MRIPIAEGVSDLPQLPGPRVPIGAGEVLGRTLAQEASQGEYLAERWQIVENRIELAKQSVESAKFLNAMTQDARTQIENPNTTLSSAESSAAFEKSLTEQVDQHVATIQNPVIRGRLQTQLLHHVNSLTNEYRGSANKAIVRNMMAEDLYQADKEAKQAALADPTTRAEIEATRLARGQMMVASGIYDPAKWQGEHQKWLYQIDHERAAVELDADPHRLAVDVYDEQKYPHFTESERHQIARSANAQAKELDNEQIRQRKREEDVFLADLGQRLDRGEYLVNGKVDVAALDQVLVGKSFEAYTHAHSLANAVERRAEVAHDKDSKSLAAKFEDQLYQTVIDDHPQGMRAILQRAQLAYAHGDMRPEDMDRVSNLYLRFDDRQDRIDRRAERDEEKADRAEKKLAKTRFRTALFELDSWFPSIKDPAMIAMAEKWTQARSLARSIASEATDNGQDPVEALRQARPAVLMALYGDAKSAIQARKGLLESKGVKTWAEIRAAKNRMPAKEWDRLVEQAQELEDLARYVATNPPPKETRGGTTGQKPIGGD